MTKSNFIQQCFANLLPLQQQQQQYPPRTTPDFRPFVRVSDFVSLHPAAPSVLRLCPIARLDNHNRITKYPYASLIRIQCIWTEISLLRPNRCYSMRFMRIVVSNISIRAKYLEFIGKSIFPHMYGKVKIPHE